MSDYDKSDKKEAEFSVCADCTTKAKCAEQAYCELEKEAGYKDKDKKKASVNVQCNLKIDTAVMSIHASTGTQMVIISGIAFHEGINKNGWEISRSMADNVAEQMKGADLTLNHPAPNAIGFSRNMDGGVDEATVGIITHAYVEDVEGGWEVRYTAEVYRKELFEALESGLWMREDYGVSIGGYGVPDEVNAETGYALFASDFTFDHLAIVYKPAYERANIEEVVSVEVETEVEVEEEEVAEVVESSDSFIYPKSHGKDSEAGESPMTDEIVNTESNEELEALRASVEEMKAKLILANATVDQYKASEEAKAEEERMALVEKASEIGLKGHEDLSADVISSLIASWEAANPEPSPVVMEEAVPAIASETISSPAPSHVVANYLNGKMCEVDENLYARAWNAWASAYNSGKTDGIPAPRYEELDAHSVDWLSRRSN